MELSTIPCQGFPDGSRVQKGDQRRVDLNASVVASRVFLLLYKSNELMIMSGVFLFFFTKLTNQFSPLLSSYFRNLPRLKEPLLIFESKHFINVTLSTLNVLQWL